MITREKIERFRKLGLKITPQRLAILEFLEGNASHPTAEDIYRYVTERFPSMSFATVYNTLEALKERGLIREIHVEGGRKRFDPNLKPHHHFICNGCGQIMDIEHKVEVKLPKEEQEKYEIQDYKIFFYGLCPYCR